jgi:hypothetical protein
MQTTMNLLTKALSVKRAAAWARDLNITEAALAQAKKRGRLSPVMAGTLAAKLQEDAMKWTALAAVEAEPEGPLKTNLLKTIESQWLFT